MYSRRRAKPMRFLGLDGAVFVHRCFGPYGFRLLVLLGVAILAKILWHRILAIEPIALSKRKLYLVRPDRTE